MLKMLKLFLFIMLMGSTYAVPDSNNGNSPPGSPPIVVVRYGSAVQPVEQAPSAGEGIPQSTAQQEQGTPQDEQGRTAELNAHVQNLVPTINESPQAFDYATDSLSFWYSGPLLNAQMDVGDFREGSQYPMTSQGRIQEERVILLAREGSQ